MKKFFTLLLTTIFLSGFVYAEKYKINPYGQIKNNSRKVTGTLPQNVFSSSAVKYIDILVDYSGSMESVVDKLKDTTKSVIDTIPKTTAVGLRKVGGDFSCTMTRQLAPIETNNASILKASLESDVYGNEPFVLGIQRAIEEDFANLDKSTPKKIIMITDGGYTCKDNPCEYAKRLIAERKDIHIDIIFVKTNFLFFSSYDDTKLSCLANTTGGMIYKTTDINSLPYLLSKSINTVSKEVASQLDSQRNNYEFIE